VLGAVAANQAGWIAAEVGRQPWIVHPLVEWNGEDVVVGSSGFVEYDEGLALRTTDGVSKAIAVEQVLGSLIMFSLVYLLLGVAWAWVLNGKIQKGPEPPEELERRRRERAGDLLDAASKRGPLAGGGTLPREGARP
jgi:cytochrome d ubiquinol oxidase subunit I